MKDNSYHDQRDETPEIQPFNSVTDHYQKIVGMPTRPADIKKLPKPIRWFGYFVFSCLLIGGIMFLILLVIQNFK
ncbi:hypothetical protein [Brevibacillus sp. SIMBA_040]|uniref:hypothetical protein n=1 Tax=unclassified Brevibacillus TaxID=2684853 RepID=UPI00397DACC7